MANTKISALTAATTPLAGTEVLPIVQSGATKQVSVSNLTGGLSTVPVSKGGTGATTLTGYVKGSGTSAMTASSTIPNTDITGLGTMSTQAASSVAITGGSINGTTVGASTASTGKFTSLTYNYAVLSGYGLNIQESGTFNDGSAHNFSSWGSKCGCAYIDSGGGVTAIPWFSNGGGGVGYTFTILDPDAGTWTYGNTVTFTSLGTGANTYSFTVSNGAGQPIITRTGGTAAYTVYIAILAG